MQPATTTTIAIPPWVPDDLRSGYHAAERGEEEAASWARQAKASGGRLAWSDEQVDHLRMRWGEGATAATIAVEIGFGATRSAVLGKVHRLRLGERRPGPAAADKRSISARPAPRVVVLRRGPARGAARTAPGRREPPPTCEPSPDGGIAIHDLETHHCRWIVAGEREHARYCGARRVEDAKTSYCAAHRAAAVRADLGSRGG